MVLKVGRLFTLPEPLSGVGGEVVLCVITAPVNLSSCVSLVNGY